MTYQQPPPRAPGAPGAPGAYQPPGSGYAPPGPGYPPEPAYPGVYPPPPYGGGYVPPGMYPPLGAFPPAGTIPPPPGMMAGFQYGGFWVRQAARSLDLIALYFLSLLLVITLVGILLVPFLWLGYFPFFWARGGTPGQKICGLRIVRERDGAPIDTGTAILRFVVILGELLLCLLIVGILAFIWVAFESRKRAWHDIAAGTVVVHAQLYSQR